MGKIQILYGLEAASGGSLKHLSYLACHLDKHVFEVTVVLSPLRSSYEANREVKKMKVHGVRVLLLPMQRNINIIQDSIAMIKILKILGTQPYDIVHAHSSKAGVLFRIAAFLRRVPQVIYTPHCFYFQSKQSWIPKYIFLFIEVALSCITDYIIVSDNEKKNIEKYYFIAKRKILNINNAIKFSDYPEVTDSDSLKEKLHIHPNDMVVGAIGRLERQKDWNTYLRVAKLVIERRPHTTFLIVGEGCDIDEIKRFIHHVDIGKKVIITGYIDEIERIYAIVDIFVNTSLWEGLPYVFLEAMHFKKPIVTTSHGNEEAVIHNETGLVSACQDYESIATSIVRLIDDKELIMRLGNNGYVHANKKFHFNEFLKKHQMAYRRE